MALRVLIVDDEPLARDRLRALLEKEPHVEIVGECAHGRDAVDQVRQKKPQLLFLDIQMPEMDGFQVLRELGDALPKVVFVTAFDKYAVKAFEAHALDYLLKPFKPARLREAVDRARREIARSGPDEFSQRIAALLRERDADPQYVTRLAVKESDRVRFVRTDDIDWIEASGNYVVLHVGATRHMIRETLGALERQLSPRQFIRLSRSALVQLTRIESLEPGKRDEQVVVLTTGTRIPATRGWREIQERMKFR